MFVLDVMSHFGQKRNSKNFARVALEKNKEENLVKIKGKLYLSCLCGKHPKNSTCEVYLRNHGKWTEEMKLKKDEELIKWLRKNGYPIFSKTLKNLIKLK